MSNVDTRDTFDPSVIFKDKPSTKAFNRCYYLTFTDPYQYTGSKNFVNKATSVSTPAATPAYSGGNIPARQITLYQNIEKLGLAIDFTITKTKVEQKKKSKNGMKLKIYNLCPINQKQIQKGDVVILDCGYNNNVANVFSGIVSTVNSNTKGSDSYIEISATELPLPDLRLFQAGSLKFTKGTTLTQVCEKICELLFELVPNIVGWDMTEIPDEMVLLRDLVFFDVNLAGHLTDLLHQVGMQYYLHAGIIYAIYSYEGSRKNKRTTITYLTPLVGMVAIPSAISKSEDSGRTKVVNGKKQKLKRQVSGWNVKSLLNPNLVINHYLDLDSHPLDTDLPADGVRGYYRIEKIVHKGNSFNSKWESTVHAYDRGQEGLIEEQPYTDLGLWDRKDG